MRFFANLALCGSLLVANVASAELSAVTNEELDAESGQAGVALALDMRLNADATGASLCGTATLPLIECRLAIGLNNRGTPNVDQEWLVFKGVFGRIYVPYLTLDADTVTYTNDTSTTTTVAAVKFGIPSLTANKLKIQNLTISNMAVEHDTSSVNRGYVAASEDGFLGLQINGNVEISGTLKMFACIPDHPRC